MQPKRDDYFDFLLATILLFVLYSGLVCGDDRPKDYFQKDPVAPTLLQGATDDRPDDYFQKPDAPTALSFESDEEPESEGVAPAPPSVQKRLKPATKPAVLPENMPSTHYRPTPSSMLARSMTIYEDLPKELMSSEVAVAYEGDLYMPPWCTACKSPTHPVRKIEADKRFKITPKYCDLPKELQPSGEFSYPLVVIDRRSFWSNLLDSPDTLINAAQQYGKSPSVSADIDDAPIVGAIAASEASEMVSMLLSPTEKPFSKGAFNLRVPENSEAKIVAVKSGMQITFPAPTKPQIKMAGWMTSWHDVHSAATTPTKIVVRYYVLGFVRQFAWKVVP